MRNINEWKTFIKSKFWFWGFEDRYPSGIAGVPTGMIPVETDEETGLPSSMEDNHHREISKHYGQINRRIFTPRGLP